MSYDRWIYFGEHAPKGNDVFKVVQDYFGALALSVRWEDDEPARLVVELVGNKSHAQLRVPQGLPGLTEALRAVAIETAQTPEPRFIELYVHTWQNRGIDTLLGRPYIDVITRHADHATNNLADGLAELLARFWGGKVDDD